VNGAACPGCVAGTEAAEQAASSGAMATHALIVPTIHCMACVSTIEKVLNARPDIKAARVNLSRKQVAITATPGEDPTPWIAALSDAGFEAHEGRDAPAQTGPDGLLLRIGIAGFAMMNVMLLSVAVWSGASESTRDLFHWVSALIALPAAIFCAEPFFASAWSALRAGRANMDVPISVAIILACGMSLHETMVGGEEAYFDAALSLTFFLLSGRYLEQRMRQTARSAAADLAALEPRRVMVLQDGAPVSCPIDDIVRGDTLWLASGSRVPVDAVLEKGSVQVDRSALTGESDPIIVHAGGNLIAGDVTLSGPVEARATVAAAGSTLRRMVELAEQAEASKSIYTSLADRASHFYTPVVHTLALVAGLAWYFYDGDGHHALMVAVSTLIITCPCALGLAVPAVATVSTGRLFRAGALVKSETALERMAQVDTVVFDKTGTLSTAALRVPELTTDELRVLKALAQASQHPLSRGLVANMDGVDPAHLDSVQEVTGRGVEAEFNGQTVRLGAADWIGEGHGTAFQMGGRVTALERQEVALPSAAPAIAELEAEGYRVEILSGDTPARAAAFARQMGVEHVHAAMTPEAKLDHIKALQAKGARVVMIGDGLNDTLALSEAWASMAPGSALEASQNAADLVLLGGDLSMVPHSLRQAKASRRRILENFGAAATYNMISIPFAVAGLATPFLAALAMSTSSVVVTVNALRGPKRKVQS